MRHNLIQAHSTGKVAGFKIVDTGKQKSSPFYMIAMHIKKGHVFDHLDETIAVDAPASICGQADIAKAKYTLAT